MMEACLLIAGIALGIAIENAIEAADIKRRIKTIEDRLNMWG